MACAFGQVLPGPVGHGPAPHHGHAPHAHAPPHYSYAYAVEDAKTAPHYAPLKFGHTEDRDGYATKGEYHVLLPDGRIQTVTYHVADDYSGYVADVTYEGVPHYGPPAAPHHAPVPHHAPKYAPPPHHL